MLSEAELADLRERTARLHLLTHEDIDEVWAHVDALTAALAAERALADDLAAALRQANLAHALREEADDSSWGDVLARHRAARQSTGGTHA